MRKIKGKYNGNDRVTVSKGGEWLHFYYEEANSLEKVYLYSRKFSLSIYKFFKNGRTMRELYSFKKWKDPKLAKLMEYKLFYSIEYVLAGKKEKEQEIDFDYMLEYRKYQEEKKMKKLRQNEELIREA